MAGLLCPYQATELVTALKEAVDIPIEMHTHYTSGVAAMTYMKSVEAGADIIDTAISPFALGTSQPATEVMVETFKGTPYDTGLDQKLLAEIADYFRPIRDEALKSRTSQPDQPRSQHQDASVSGARRNAFQPHITAQGAGSGGQSSTMCLRKCRAYGKTSASRRL